MMKYILILLALTSCSQKEDFSTPAQAQIDAYRLKAKQCLVSQKSQSVPAATSITANTSDIFSIDDEDLVVGNPQSTVTLIEYGAPTCAHCAFFYQKIYPDIKKNYVDTMKIRYVFREYIGNKQDLDATILVHCSNKDKKVQLLDVIYNQQEGWAANVNYRNVLNNIAGLSGISQDQYESCLNNKDLSSKLIGKSRAVFRIPGFTGTPGFVVNGTLYSGEYTYKGIAKALDDAIAKTTASRGL